jgi:hypothetical protein
MSINEIHQPIHTYHVDVRIDDSEENRRGCEAALASINAEWGKTDEEWGPVSKLAPGWLAQQGVFSLITPFGALDIFRSVNGLNNWAACWERATEESTSAGVPYRGLSDEDMLQCQLALPAAEQKLERVRVLRDVIAQSKRPT